MKEEFINFYKKELGVWKLVYQYMNKFVLSLYVIFLIGLGSLFVVSLFTQYYYYSLLLFFLLFIEGVILNNHNKMILEKIHKISRKDQGWTWGGPLFSKMRYEKLELFLLKKLDSEEQLQKLIQLLHTEAESRKFSGIFVRGLGLGLFLPLWNYFMKWLFSNELNEINTAIILFLITLIFIGIIVYFISIIKIVLLDYFDRESIRIHDLANMLEDISIKPLNFKNKISS